jgi:hypothetical protein
MPGPGASGRFREDFSGYVKFSTLSRGKVFTTGKVFSKTL